MNWITLSILMFFSSIALYINQRYMQKLGLPSRLISLSMFVPPLFIYAGIALGRGENFTLNKEQWLTTMVMAVLFSYSGNLMSVKANEYAPNPGYSLIISKSYVVFTTIVAVKFFGAEITWTKGVAILCILGFSSLIVFTKGTKKKHENRLWLPLAIGAFFSLGMLTLTARTLFNQGVAVIPLLTYVHFFVIICIAIELWLRKIHGIKDAFFRCWRWLLCIGVLNAAFNLFMYQALKEAPNVGYVNAINASSISFVTIVAALVFHDDFSRKKFIGVIGVTAGLLMLLLS